MQTIHMIKKLLFWAVFFGFITGVEYLWGWAQLLKPWQSLNPTAIAFGVLLFFLTYQIRTWRLYDYFEQDIKDKWVTALRLMLIHNTLNILLPMRSGEVSFPVLMKRYFNITYERSIPALLWFRLLDLHTLLSFAVIPLLFSQLNHLSAAMLSFLWLMLPIAGYWVGLKIDRHLPCEVKGWKKWLRKVIDGLPKLHWLMIKCWALTWLNWLVKLMVLAWVMGQFLEIPYLNQLLAVIAGELTSIVPFHAPAGVGTYEAGITASLISVAPLEDSAQAAINVHLFMLSSALIGGLIGWLLPKHPTIGKD